MATRTPAQQKSTARKRASFLHALAQSGVVTHAAEVAKCDRVAMYRLRAEDADFAAAWDDALEQAADRLELAARRRAEEGVLEPVVSMGKIVRGDDGEPLMVRKYSDSLAQFLLKGMRPEKFRDNVNVTAQGTNFGVTVVMERIQNDPRYAERANELARLIAGAADESGRPG